MKRSKMKANVLGALVLVVTMLMANLCIPAMASGETQDVAENPVNNLEDTQEKEMDVSEDGLTEQVNLTPPDDGALENPESESESDLTEPTSDPEQLGEEPEDDEDLTGDETIGVEPLAEYTVRFLNADDTVFTSVTLNEGDSILEPKTDPSLEGYAFQYWYNVKEGEKKSFAFGTDVIATEDLVLKAFFEQKEEVVPEDEASPEGEEVDRIQTVEIRFVVEDQVTSLILNEGDTLEKLETDPEREGAAFLYWFDQKDSTMAQFQFGHPVEADLTLVALFEEEQTPERNVTIATSASDAVRYGDEIEMTGILTGFDDCAVSFRWRYSADGENWVDTDGTGLTYSFVATEETLGYIWGLSVKIMN